MALSRSRAFQVRIVRGSERNQVTLALSEFLYPAQRERLKRAKRRQQRRTFVRWLSKILK